MALCGIAIAAGVIGVVAVVKRLFFYRYRRFGGPMGFGGGCGPSFAGDGSELQGRSCGGGRWSRRGGGGPGRSFWLRALFSRLDTTPGQEREIRSAIEDFQRTAYQAKDSLSGVRADFARAISGELFDDGAANEATGRADATAATIKDALTAALKRVHAVLDPNQRGRLAEILEKGPGFGRRWGNPYRDAAH